MELLVWITTVLLVVGVGGVAVFKLSNNEEAIEQAKRLGYEPIRRLTSYAELLGVAGVVIGAVSSDLEWLGILAAAGLAGMMLGAIVYHRRAGDTWPTMPSIVMLILSVLYIVGLTGT
ncbi:MAG: DoxX family protein [bacterium]|nr:DoxX family protein [bacterium]